MSNLNKPVRRVSFHPFCRVREFGLTEYEDSDDEKKDSVKNGKTWVNGNPNKPLPPINWDYISSPHCQKPVLDLNTSMAVMTGESHRSKTSEKRPPSFKTLLPKMTKDDPEWKHRQTSVRLLKHKMVREFEFGEVDSMAKKLKKSHGVIWTQPTALNDIRENWKCADEMESANEQPGDTEFDSTPPSAPRKKKMLTRKERYNRQVIMRKTNVIRKDEMSRRIYFKKNLQNFIEKARNFIPMRSIVSKENEHIDNDTYKSFGLMRTTFAKNNRRKTRKVDFEVRRNINRRLANPDLCSKLRIAYQTILENYDSILGPHFYYLFDVSCKRQFYRLEKVFLLNH